VKKKGASGTMHDKKIGLQLGRYHPRPKEDGTGEKLTAGTESRFSMSRAGRKSLLNMRTKKKLLRSSKDGKQTL